MKISFVKLNMLRLGIIALCIILIISLLAMITGLISYIFFWIIIAAAAIFAFKILPRLNLENKSKKRNKY